MLSNEQIELRKKLMRRLIWKAPLIIGLMSFAVWWQSRKEIEPQREMPAVSAISAAALAGNWHAQISYPSGAKYDEQFFFQPEGAKLFGTASFLGVKHGIEDGEIVGETLMFKVRFEEASDSATQLRWNRYEGMIVGAEIRMKVFDDKGNVPVEFSLTQASGVSIEKYSRR